MAELDQNQQNDFIIEKIKERPVNKKKLFRRTVITAAMAVIFGLIACLTFLILEPVFSNWLYPEEDPQIIVFPEDQEEVSPEDMLSDSTVTEEETQEGIALEEEQIQEILSGVTLNRENYKQMYDALSVYVTELRDSMVTVTGVTSDVDWFDNELENKGHSSGLIIGNNGKELLILADYSLIKDAEKLSMTFSNNQQVDTQIKQYDVDTNIAILSVEISSLPEEMADIGIMVASLGTSSGRSIVGQPVIALGSPMGSSDSVGYGIISSASGQVAVADANFRLLMTDIYGSEDAGGFLFNLQGQVIGIITNSANNENIISAYGISDIKRIVEKMSNGSKRAYLGIIGVDVTTDAHNDMQVPYGVYVTEAVMDSPAMLAGIQQGDVIVAMDETEISNVSAYTSTLIQLNAGDIVELIVMRMAQEEYREMRFEITLVESK